MDEKIVALKLILDHLHVGQVINTVEQRMETQKAIYLAQSKGVDLGYSYGWYLKGPYSPKLTRDYYAIHDEDNGDVTEGRALKPRVRGILDELKMLIDSPAGGLARPHWLELLASIRYLMLESEFSSDRARRRIDETKPHLSRYFNQGLEALRGQALV